MDSNNRLDQLLNPKTIAVIGASADKNKIGSQIFKKLLKSKDVVVYPVNPKRKKIFSRICYPTVNDIPGAVSQAIIVIPALVVPGIIQQCAEKKISSVVVISSGFSETGQSGKKIEREIKNICKKNQLTLLGPNCLGYANLNKNIDVTFAKVSPSPGNISIASQSGAIGSFLFDWAKKENLGFSRFVSLGNRAGVTEIDCLKNFASDKDCQVIGLYLESFADGRQFLTVASQVSRQKPVIVLFAGKTQTGRKAVQSHTAALSPKASVIKAALRQTGCILANSLEEMTDLLEIFSLEPPLLDNDLVIVSNAGGPGILAVDAAANLDISGFSAKIRQSLKQTLPSQVQINNPVDLLGDAMADRFHSALKIISKDKLKDAFLIILTPQTTTQPEKTARAIVKVFRSIKKPVVVTIMGGHSAEKAKQILQKNHIATIDFPQKAVKYLRTLYRYWHWQTRRLPYPVRQVVVKKIPRKKVLAMQKGLEKGILSWQQSDRLAKIYHLPLVKTQVIKTSNLETVVRKFGFPLVLKSDPREAIHRTEEKGLYLNNRSMTAVKKSYQTLSKNFNIILAQPQITKGVELFIGFKRERGFPPLVTVGSGGIYTEIYQDVAQAFLPLNRKLVLQILNQTKIGQIIQGVRGLPPQSVKQTITMILNLSCLIQDFNQIKEINVNPAIISEDDIQIVDLKISLAASKQHTRL